MKDAMEARALVRGSREQRRRSPAINWKGLVRVPARGVAVRQFRLDSSSVIGITVQGLRGRAAVCTPIDTTRCDETLDVLDAGRPPDYSGGGGRGGEEKYEDGDEARTSWPACSFGEPEERCRGRVARAGGHKEEGEGKGGEEEKRREERERRWK